MAALITPEVNKGWKAPTFKLKNIDGKIYDLESARSKNGLVVMFICNHCPFVKAIAPKIASDASKLMQAGVGVVAINSNDASVYPEDAFENMAPFARANNFNFPYLHDATQEVAKNYDAVCTPDFFGFNKNLELQYRGRFDESGMKNMPNAKHELLDAMLEIAKSGEFKGKQIPSIGCSIKWKS